MSIVEVQNLKKEYDNKFVLKGINFNLQKGDFMGILGQNGAGKSTTINILLGLAKRTSGIIKLFDEECQGKLSNNIISKIGYVDQGSNLYPDLTIYENLMFFSKLRFINSKTAKSAVDEAIDMLNLENHKDKLVRKLSGGLKRRTALARAILFKPELLILDEPTSGLDPQIKIEFWEILLKLKEKGLTILMSSHYMDEVDALCNKIAIFKDGVVIADGKVDQLKHLLGDQVVYIDSDDLKDNKDVLLNLNFVRKTVKVGKATYEIILNPEIDPLSLNLNKTFIEKGIKVSKIIIKKVELEDVYTFFTNVKKEMAYDAI